MYGWVSSVLVVRGSSAGMCHHWKAPQYLWCAMQVFLLQLSGIHTLFFDSFMGVNNYNAKGRALSVNNLMPVHLSYLGICWLFWVLPCIWQAIHCVWASKSGQCWAALSLCMYMDQPGVTKCYIVQLQIKGKFMSVWCLKASIGLMEQASSCQACI